MFLCIIENELKQAIFQDENYLESQWNGTMETSDKDLDQNPMGLVKFMFWNSNAIYLQ
jgi:hypothetical protein